MSPKIKLTYFDLKGRAELSRLILAQAGVEYEDCRITGAAWTAFKPNSLYGSVPELEFDGERIGQSNSIARFLAREYGLAGKNNIEAAQLDAIIDSSADILNAGMKFHFEKDETRKMENKEKFMNDVLPTFLKRCEKMLADNGGEWFVGSDITWVDMNSAVTLTILNEMFKVEWKSPVLAAHQAKVYAMPNIKKYIDNRPKTSF